MSNRDDLLHYTFLNMLINSRFDSYAEVQRILQASASEPGSFAKALQALPKNVMSDLRGNHFKPVAVPAISDGLSPPPRESAGGSGSE